MLPAIDSFATQMAFLATSDAPSVGLLVMVIIAVLDTACQAVFAQLGLPEWICTPIWQEALAPAPLAILLEVIPLLGRVLILASVAKLAIEVEFALKWWRLLWAADSDARPSDRPEAVVRGAGIHINVVQLRRAFSFSFSFPFLLLLVLLLLRCWNQGVPSPRLLPLVVVRRQTG